MKLFSKKTPAAQGNGQSLGINHLFVQRLDQHLTAGPQSTPAKKTQECPATYTCALPAIKPLVAIPYGLTISTPLLIRSKVFADGINTSPDFLLNLMGLERFAKPATPKKQTKKES
jgi:hypothetical protein